MHHVLVGIVGTIEHDCRVVDLMPPKRTALASTLLMVIQKIDRLFLSSGNPNL